MLRDFRCESASVRENVHGECHMIGGVERWWEVESIQRWVSFSEGLCAW
jgi:hypothetical protein